MELEGCGGGGDENGLADRLDEFVMGEGNNILAIAAILISDLTVAISDELIEEVDGL